MMIPFFSQTNEMLSIVIFNEKLFFFFSKMHMKEKHCTCSTEQDGTVGVGNLVLGVDTQLA